MRFTGGVGVGAFFGTAFVGAGGVVEIEEDDVELVELVDEGGRGGRCSMMLGVRRARNRWECSMLRINSEPAACRSKIAWAPKNKKMKEK